MTTLEPDSTGSLAARAMVSLRAFFDERDHRPSANHWDALRDIADTIEKMAMGSCAPKVWLSSCDPGVGKSQTVIHALRALVEDPTLSHVGAMICVGRIAEARAIASDIGIPRERLAVLTADDEANALGGAPPDQAQVLITTQQRLERVCEGRPFAHATPFFFMGRPRQVRAWDEAWLPGVAVTLSADDVFGLAGPVRRMSRDLAEALLDFANTLRGTQDGAMVDVPDFGLLCDTSLYEVLATVAGLNDRHHDDKQMAATALLTVSGRRARVRVDGHDGKTVLTYRDTLPSDLAPLLVLDASGRVRETYRYIEQHRGTLERLREATKDYAPLTVHTWRTAGSKSGFASNGDALSRGITETILMKPTETWLIVVHKPGGKVRDVERAIRRPLTADINERVKVITWGQHLATNLYADVANVCLAGTLFMRPSFYAALTHLAQDRDVGPGLVSGEDIAKTMRGEHRHLVLQALCRGRVRKSDGNRCLPMSAYIIASPKSGIPGDLTGIFPGCTVRDWSPLGKSLTGAPKRALDVVRAELARGALWISYGDIASSLKMDRKNFNKLVVKRADWQDAVASLGFIEGQDIRRAKGLRVSSPQVDRMAA